MANKQEDIATVETKIPFSEYLATQEHMPARSIVRKIDENTFPFNKNTFFTYNTAKLGATEFNRCVELYSERVPEGGDPRTVMMLMHEIMQDEAPNTEELQNLAIDLVRKMYNVPDNIDMKGMIKNLNADEECGNCPPEQDNISDERKEELQAEIEKRRILNTICHGSSVYAYSTAYYLVMEELNALNPVLLGKYNKLSALVNYWNWKFDAQEAMEMGQMPLLQGINKIDIKNKKIEASAMNFPVLIHELSKGVMEYMIAWGLPKISDDELRYVYKEADKYSHEAWHYFFGPTLWLAMLKTADAESKDLPKIIMEMSKMDYVDLANFCIDVTFHPETLGKKQMDAIKKKAF